MRTALRELDIDVSIGITSGSAYSGFVGSNTRREMCAMGSIVNMAARLMGKAGDNGILVDEETHESAHLMVAFRAVAPVQVKGRDKPLAVFSPEGLRTTQESTEMLLAVVKDYMQIERLPAQFVKYWEGIAVKSGCSPNQARKTAGNMLDFSHVVLTAGGDLEVLSNLDDLDHGLTREQALGKAESLFDKLHIHEQMLVKVLSHELELFSISSIYCSLEVDLLLWTEMIRILSLTSAIATYHCTGNVMRSAARSMSCDLLQFNVMRSAPSQCYAICSKSILSDLLQVNVDAICSKFMLCDLRRLSRCVCETSFPFPPFCWAFNQGR